MTSRDVTTRVYHVFRPTKVGHVGTLDPIATGVLVMAIGNATRLSERLHEHAKEYVARFRLGFDSDTQDITGNVVETDEAAVTLADLQEASKQFVGRISQTPPAFSATKVGGKRAYDLARAGRPIALEPRKVDVFDLEVRPVTAGNSEPAGEPLREFELFVRSGSGTYVRTLGRDLAKAVGSCCVMTGLRRTRVGPFDESSAISFDRVSADTPLIDCQIAVADLPKRSLTREETRRVLHGNAIKLSGTEPQVVLLTADERLLAVAERQHQLVQPRVVFKDAVRADAPEVD